MKNGNLQLIKTEYISKKQSNDNKDAILLFTKDENGKKECKIIKEPKLTYYVSKKEFWGESMINSLDIEKTKVNTITSRYSEIFKSMTETLNDPTFTRTYQNIFNEGGNIGYNLKKLHLDDRFHNSDINIEDFYIDLFLQENPYTENYYPLTRSFYDIEVDTTNCEGFPDPEEALHPVNIITWVNESTFESFSFMLKYDNDSYHECMNDLDSVREQLKDKYNNYQEGLGDKFKFHFNEYDDELELIKAFFDKINEYKPDFCLAWNASFDYVYLFNRIINLGGNPNDIICPDEIPYKKASYYLDTKNNEPSDKSDEYRNISYTNWMDSMNIYASVLKSSGRLESYALDFVAKQEIGIGKEDTGEGLGDLHIKDYKKFLIYNIQDTVLLQLLEQEKNHIETIYLIGMLTHTRLSKGLKKTISLRNFAMIFARNNGRILSNNRSHLFRGMSEGKFKGAFVANPNLIDNVGKVISSIFQESLNEDMTITDWLYTILKKDNHNSTTLHDLVQDLDLASLYPSIISAFNISANNCQLQIHYYNEENREEETEKFMDHYMTSDSISFGVQYLNLPSIDQMANKIKEDFGYNAFY